MDSLLSIAGLDVRFALPQGQLRALHSISLNLNCGERLGVVGESGAGKSVLGFAITQLLSKPGYIHSGTINFDGQNLIGLSADALRKIRGNRIAMIFQDPMVTLNPVLTIETQMLECLLAHRRISTQKARAIAIEKLTAVQIPSPEIRLKQYPHELSGGMRQRVVIAIALLLDPELVIADEPTTALDVTIQAEIMLLLKQLCEEHNMALILITHDLGVVAQMTHNCMVLYAGSIVEQGETQRLIQNPMHPYTEGLINALPQKNKNKQRLNQIPGSMPTLHNLPQGCAFSPRCNHKFVPCENQLPYLATLKNRQVACHLYEGEHGK